MADPVDRILFVDDELHVRLSGEQTLELAGYRVDACGSADQALAALEDDFPGILVSDIRMPGMDGMALLAAVQQQDPDLPVILITGHGDISLAVTALKQGAYDFLEKPYHSEALLDAVHRALEKRALVLENRRLRQELKAQCEAGDDLIGRSPAMVRLKAAVAQIAATDADCLIEGETGTGKEVVARALHRLSPRRTGPFVALNCGALPENIMESELFGHESGSFTGASRRRVGKLEHASGGILFLDEIESMPLSLGVRLLRVLQERVVERLGSNTPIPLDIRVVAATKSDLKALAAEGRFREDLYYRLNVVTLPLPPLRERPQDIPLLFTHFAQRAATRHGRPAPTLDPGLSAELSARHWPGNVRELMNAAERWVLGYAPDLGRPSQAPSPGRESSPGTESGPGQATGDPVPDAGPTLTEQLAAFEKTVLEQALTASGGNVTAACRRLGVARKTFYDKLARYGLRREQFRRD